MGSYSSADILCPCYFRDDAKTCTLTCEGLPPGSSVRNHFSSGRAMREQIGRYCAGSYRSCPWAGLLTIKYQD